LNQFNEQGIRPGQFVLLGIIVALIAIVSLVNGNNQVSDLPNYFDLFNDRQIKSTSYLCESSETTRNQQIGKADHATLVSRKTKGDPNFEANGFAFVLTEYHTALFSKYRKWGHRYYTLKEVSGSSNIPVTYNVLPEQSLGFTSIKEIENGYRAKVRKFNKVLRENEESVTVDDARIIAKMSDVFYDKDLFQAQVPDERIKADEIPVRQMFIFKMNRASGQFMMSRWFVKHVNETSYEGDARGIHDIGICKSGSPL
jgi:hypothetical protein